VSEGTVFQRSDCRWCAKYKDAHGNWKYLYRKSKAEAKRALRQALKDRDEGIIPPAKMSVANLLDEWLEDMQGDVSHRTWLNREGFVRLHIKATIGTTKLAKLTADDARKLYKRKLAEGMATSSVKRIHVILNQAMRYSVRLKYISNNPLDDVKPPTVKGRAMDVLTPEQVNRLLDTVYGNRFECVIVLGALCALRVGEALSIRYEDIDFIEGTISIRRTLWRNQTYSPKTDASAATIKIPVRALDALRRHAARHGTPKEGWLFQTKNGNPVAAPNFHNCWKRLLRKAGLPESTTFHQLRHGVGSMMVNQQIPLPIVSKYLRHSTPRITAEVYLHMIDGTGGMAATGLDAAIGMREPPHERHLRAL
jgi:integrase